jgi:uncharacterized cupredoxin-like copper-binding protein
MKSARGSSSRVWVVGGILATVIFAGLSLVAAGALGGGSTRGVAGAPSGSGSCTVPKLSGSVVNISLTNMGGPMMGGGSAQMSGGAMRLRADQGTVKQGTMSFFVTNNGSVTHELVVLPLPQSQIVGTQPIGGDGKIDETGSLGEASNTCGQGSGEGILPGASGWVTVTLPSGRYELICNLPGHYAAGMYSQLTVR